MLSRFLNWLIDASKSLHRNRPSPCYLDPPRLDAYKRIVVAPRYQGSQDIQQDSTLSEGERILFQIGENVYLGEVVKVDSQVFPLPPLVFHEPLKAYPYHAQTCAGNEGGIHESKQGKSDTKRGRQSFPETRDSQKKIVISDKLNHHPHIESQTHQHTFSAEGNNPEYITKITRGKLENQLPPESSHLTCRKISIAIRRCQYGNV